MRRKILATASAIALLFSLSSCAAFSDDSSSVTTDGPYTVATSFYPITWLTEKIGGEYVTVTSLTPPNVEPHEYELSPKEVAELEKTQAVIYASGFQPALDKAIEEADVKNVLDLSKDLRLLSMKYEDAVNSIGKDDHHSHGINDPHFWLSPEYMMNASSAVASMLATIDPAHADSYRQNAEELESELGVMSSRYAEELENCWTTTLITDHAAFGYIADRHDLKAMPLSLDAESEPSPARLEELKKLIKDEDIKVIFAEEGTDDSAIATLAQDTGVTIAYLSTLERAPENSNYLKKLEDNLNTISDGLDCMGGGALPSIDFDGDVSTQ